MRQSNFRQEASTPVLCDSLHKAPSPLHKACRLACDNFLFNHLLNNLLLFLKCPAPGFLSMSMTGSMSIILVEKIPG